MSAYTILHRSWQSIQMAYPVLFYLAPLDTLKANSIAKKFLAAKER